MPFEKVGRGIPEGKGYAEDAIVKLSPDGEILFQKSVSQIFIDNGLEYLLFSIGDEGFKRDPIHLNDIQPVDFNSQFWKKGDLFLSLRHQSMILLYRPSSNKIIWKGTGPFFHQHDVNILNDHQMWSFDETTIISPYHDLDILQKGLGLDVDNVIKQVTEGIIQKEIITRTNKKLIDELDKSKNASDPVGLFLET